MSESSPQAQPFSNILESRTGLVRCAYYQSVRLTAMKFNNTEEQMGWGTYDDHRKYITVTIKHIVHYKPFQREIVIWMKCSWFSFFFLHFLRGAVEASDWAPEIDQASHGQDVMFTFSFSWGILLDLLWCYCSPAYALYFLCGEQSVCEFSGALAVGKIMGAFSAWRN